MHEADIREITDSFWTKTKIKEGSFSKDFKIMSVTTENFDWCSENVVENYQPLKATSDNYFCCSTTILFPLLSFKIRLKRWASLTAHDTRAAPYCTDKGNRESQRESASVPKEDKLRGEERKRGEKEKGQPSIVFSSSLFPLEHLVDSNDKLNLQNLQNALQATQQQIKNNYTNNKNLRRPLTKDKNAPCIV